MKRERPLTEREVTKKILLSEKEKLSSYEQMMYKRKIEQAKERRKKCLTLKGVQQMYYNMLDTEEIRPIIQALRDNPQGLRRDELPYDEDDSCYDQEIMHDMVTCNIIKSPPGYDFTDFKPCRKGRFLWFFPLDTKIKLTEIGKNLKIIITSPPKKQEIQPAKEYEDGDVIRFKDSVDDYGEIQEQITPDDPEWDDWMGRYYHEYGSDFLEDYPNPPYYIVISDHPRGGDFEMIAPIEVLLPTTEEELKDTKWSADYEL